jgi:two-component system chemotaxis response regulator CheY
MERPSHVRPSIPVAGYRRAIVIDDSRAMRSMLRSALETCGFAVSEASDGLRALPQLAEAEPFHLALVDWNMPGMDGLKLIGWLRANPRYDRMVIVMVTSEAEPSQIERALAAGANEYIMKPLSQEVLIEKLRLLEEEQEDW